MVFTSTSRLKRPAASSSRSTKRVRPSKQFPPTIPSRASLTSLPYHLILQILLYTIPSPPAVPSNSTHLLALATLSQSLYEPAISALYHSPCTVPPARAHRLLSALQAKPDLGWKIKSLVLDIEPLLSRKTPGLGYFNVSALFGLAKGVKEVWLRHDAEYPPYRKRLQGAERWQYPEELWTTMNAAETRLKSWRWNGMFMPYLSVEDCTKLNLSPCFQSLERLSYIYADDLPLSENAPKDSEADSDVFGHLLGLLPNLRELELECSETVNSPFFASLSLTAPQLQLTRLSLINCPNLDATSLTTFLLSPSCHTLLDLSVWYSRACSLSFLSALSNTPGLRNLEFDGLYFSPTDAYNDAQPLFETLLPAETTPCWPEALQGISLLNMRKWSADECSALLDSLWNARLPHLGGIQVHCIIDDLGWRERAEFRDKWVDRLMHKFIADPTAVAPSSLQIMPPPNKASLEVADDDTSPRTRRSARAREKAPVRTHRSSTTPPPKETRFTSTCHPSRVEIKIDNLRPTEQQYEESDFLDVGGPRIWRRAGGARKKKAVARGGRKRAGKKKKVKTVVVRVDAEESSGDEEYVDD